MRTVGLSCLSQVLKSLEEMLFGCSFLHFSQLVVVFYFIVLFYWLIFNFKSCISRGATPISSLSMRTGRTGRERALMPWGGTVPQWRRVFLCGCEWHFVPPSLGCPSSAFVCVFGLQFSWSAWEPGRDSRFLITFFVTWLPIMCLQLSKSSEDHLLKQVVIYLISQVIKSPLFINTSCMFWGKEKELRPLITILKYRLIRFKKTKCGWQ